MAIISSATLRRRCPVCGAAGNACTHHVPAPGAAELMPEGRIFVAHKSDRRLYLDAEGNVVEADNPKKLTLLVAEGGELPMDQARQYGLVQDEPGDAAAEAKAENRRGAAQKPAETATVRDSALEIARPDSAPKGGQKTN
jgi:hypothetical protein